MLKIFIWGTGQIAESLLKNSNVFNTYEILGFIDNKIDKKNNKFYGKNVYSPDVLCTVVPDKIVVLNDYFEEIILQVRETYPELIGIVENKYFFYKQSLIRRYKNVDDAEIQEILNYLQSNYLDVFNYDFKKQYSDIEIIPIFDNECDMYYVVHKGKRLYFAKYMHTEKEVIQYYRGLLIEQDEKSPHRYLSADFDVEEGDVVVDVGVAEGNFSLEVIDKASKVYMIESDKGWIEALQQTFKDYSDKVEIVEKYVGSLDEGKCATLDMLIDEPINFLKMDIEGNEWDALMCAGNLIEKSKVLKCAVCSYHRDYDEILIRNVFERHQMECSVTNGYMWFPCGNDINGVSTRLCRGIVRGRK